MVMKVVISPPRTGAPLFLHPTLPTDSRKLPKKILRCLNIRSTMTIIS